MSFSKTLLFTLSVAGLLTFAGVAQAQGRTAAHVSSPTRASTQMATGRTSGSFNNWHHHRGHNSNFVFFGGFGYPFGFGGYPYGYGYYPYDYGYYGYGYNPYGYGYPAYGNYYNGAAPPVYSGEAIGNGGSSVIAQVQQILARNGYYRGTIDGVIGSGTRGAIRAYERAHGLAVDGRINRQLLARMGLA